MFFDPREIAPPANSANPANFLDAEKVYGEGAPPANSANPANFLEPHPRADAEISRISEISSRPESEPESEISKISKISSTPAFQENAPGDRRTCNDCDELHRGLCRAAARGEIPHAARRYEPIRDRLHRCLSYRPGPEDADRRTGRERFPGMARRFASILTETEAP